MDVRQCWGWVCFDFGHGIQKFEHLAIKFSLLFQSCHVILAILEALNVSHIDWLSLDLEGYELPVLFTFPWSTVSVDVIEVEVKRGPDKGDTIPKKFAADLAKQFFLPTFFNKLGYELVIEHGRDHVYAKKSKFLI